MNGLMCKTKGKFDEIVLLQLVDAYCKPFLLYGSEVYWGGGLNLMTLLWEEHGVIPFGKYLVLVKKLPVTYNYLFTGICLLKDTLNRSRLANTGNDVIAYLKDLMSVYW